MELWILNQTNCSQLCQPKFQPRHCNSSAITSSVWGTPGNYMTISPDRCESKGWSHNFLENVWPWQGSSQVKHAHKRSMINNLAAVDQQLKTLVESWRNLITKKNGNCKKFTIQESMIPLHSITLSCFLLIAYILGTNISPYQSLHFLSRWFSDFPFGYVETLEGQSFTSTNCDLTAELSPPAKLCISVQTQEIVNAV